MTQLLGIPLDLLAKTLVIITALIIIGVLILAIRNRSFFKIGVRNIPRRRGQVMLIVCALMLSTTLLTGVLATGDVIEAGVQTVAVYNLGSVDEAITGGHGPLGTFDDYVYFRSREVARNDPDIAAVGAALVENNLLVADVTSRQVRSKVTALAILPGTEQGFGGMRDISTQKIDTISALGPNAVYLNQTAATLMNAHVGDTIYLYSQRWQGRRYEMLVRGIVTDGGLVGQKPYILSQYTTFLHIEGYRDAISEVYISLRNPNDPGGVDVSEQVENELRHAIPGDVHVSEVKEAGVKAAQTADDLFSRIFGLFALFALSIGLLLIFLIFVLLAAERRAEMGMARAIGVQRRHLGLMYVFQGTVYELVSPIVRLLIGSGVGALVVAILGPILARFNFPFQLVFQPRSLVIAFCLGVIFPFLSIGIAAWQVSRMTVADALRNLPESGRPTLTMREAIARFRTVGIQLPEAIIGMVATLSRLGLLPLLAGSALLNVGLQQKLIAPFSLGLSLIVIGAGLLLKVCVTWALVSLGKPRWTAGLNRLFAALMGLAILA